LREGREGGREGGREREGVWREEQRRHMSFSSSFRISLLLLALRIFPVFPPLFFDWICAGRREGERERDGGVTRRKERGRKG
jgi:hypothetical protein